MKLTLKNNNGNYVVNQPGEETLSEAIQLFGQLLRSAGYYFDGELTIEESNGK